MLFFNFTGPLQVLSSSGIIVLVIGAIFFIITIYIFIKVLRDFVVNAIIGGIGLIIFHFLFPFFFGLEIPITLANIVIALIAGLPGLVIIVILSVFGIS